MSVNNKQLREGIIAKLKDYEAYVDNELPDYIMVMLANNKTVHQINNDLQLFLGENTDRFTTWLQRAISDPAAMMERETETSQQHKEPVRIAGTKRKRESTPLLDELEDYEEEEVEEIHVEERETESPPPPRVATAPSVNIKRDEEEGEREEERERPRERQREREGERRREREEGGSPTKVMKMADREGEESRSRSQRSSAIAKKIIRVLQPDSSRDQDLRELIAQRRKEKSHHSHHHRHGDEHDHHRQPQQQDEEGSDGGTEDDIDNEGEGEGGRQLGSVASVVKMVHTERPHRSDKGGSRLLHRAILGIKSGGKRSSKSREGASSSSTTTASSTTSKGKSTDPPSRTKSSSSSKHSSVTDRGHGSSASGDVICEDGEAREGSEGVEEVLVEVDREGAMDDEFRQEQQLEKTKKKLSRDAMEKSTIAAVQKVLPLGGRLRLTDVRARIGRVQRSLGAERRSRGERRGGRESEEGEGEEDEEVDLRDVLNRKKEKPSESSTRFVVTLSGADDNYPKDPPSDLEEEEEEEREREGERGERKIEKVVGISLSRLRRYNSQAVEESKVVEREETAEQEMEEDYEEDNTGGRGLGGLPERCRFWPNCKNGDSCPYHHPSVPCRLFPNCKYGNKCHFIHPQCKFDARCTRADCPYLHTAPRHLSMPYSSPVVAPPPAPIAPMITQPIFSPFTSRFSYGRPSPWQQPRPQRYPNKSALSWTPGVKGGVSERQFAVPDDQTTALPV